MTGGVLQSDDVKPLRLICQHNAVEAYIGNWILGHNTKVAQVVMEGGVGLLDVGTAAQVIATERIIAIGTEVLRTLVAIVG